MNCTIEKIRLPVLAGIFAVGLLAAGIGCAGPSYSDYTSSSPTTNPNSDTVISQLSSGAGGNVAVPSVNGFSGAILTDVTVGAGANATIEDQTNAVLPPPAYPGAILYLSMMVSNLVTFSGSPSLSFQISVPPGTSGQYYLAFYDPTQATPAWVAASIGPATVNSQTAVVFNTSSTITLQANQTYWWALYP
jgi:hypothetical protein